MTFRSYLIAIAVAVACVAGTAVSTHAGKPPPTLLETRPYGPPYSESSTEIRQDDCSPPDVCESSASADALTGQVACTSDVAKTSPTSTIGKALVVQKDIPVPSRTTHVQAISRWNLTGTSSASGDAVANATVQLQILDASGALLTDSHPHGSGLSVHGLGSDPAEAVVNMAVDAQTPRVNLGPKGKAPTQLTLRAILQCTAQTGELSGAATVDVVTGEHAGDQATRLLELVVEFYRQTSR